MIKAIQAVKAGLAFVDSKAPGTGFFLAPDLVLTCDHVAKGDIEIVTIKGGAKKAVVIKRSAELDLALLKTESNHGVQLEVVRRNKGVGTDVAFLGFPFPDIFCPPLAMAVKTAVGNRYKIDGVDHYVLNAMIGEGYSGSPLFLDTGEICGLVTSRFDPLRSGARRKRGGAPISSITFALTSRVFMDWVDEKKVGA